MYYRNVRGKSNIKNAVLPLKKRYLRTYTYILAFAGMTLAYLGLTLIPSPDRRVLTQYHLSPASYRWLLYPAIILLVASWILTVVAALGVLNYARLIKNSGDGKGFWIIGIGIIVLSLSQPLGGLITNMINHIERHVPNSVPTLTIINNYLNLFWTGLTLILLAWGAQKLLDIIKRPKDPINNSAWTIFFIVLSSVYSYFIVIQPIHALLAKRAYFLPDWLLVATIAIPYTCVWYVGLRGAYKLYLYQRNVSGALYKQALNYLAAGFVVVVISSVATRIITTISSRLSQLSLTPILFIVYGLILIYALGFVLIAIGAAKLKRIEEA